MKKCRLAKCFIIPAMLLLLLPGCSSSQLKKYGFDKDNPVSIKIWNYYNGPQLTAFDKIVSQFNETVGKEQGIIVEAFSQGSIGQLEESVLNSANKKVGSEAMPDIFSAYSDSAYTLNKMNMLADFDQYLTTEEMDEYVDSYIEEGRIGSDGKLRIFPIAKSMEVTVLNKTDWDKFATAVGVNTDALSTWEGMAETAKKYYEWTDSQTEQKDDGKAFFGRDSMANYMIIGSGQLGVELFQVQDDEVKLNLDEAVMKSLWENYYVPTINGYYFSYGRFRSDDLKTGDIICYVGSTSGTLFFPETVTVNDSSTYPIESMTLAVPKFENGENMLVQQGAGFVVTKSDAAHEYASTLFLKFFTDVSQNIEFSTSSGYLPVKKKACDLSLVLETLEQSEIKGNKKALNDTLTVALKQNENAVLYTPKAFENGNKARSILENSLSSKALADVEQIKKLVQEGYQKEEAVKLFDTEENFQQWFQSLKTELNEAIK